MLKKIALSSMLLAASASMSGVIPVNWQENADRLATRIAAFPDKFKSDTILYNETSDRLSLFLTMFADEVENIQTVFTCLREKYAALVEQYNQVLIDTEISIEDAAIKKLLLEGELAALIEEMDATIARVTDERDVLKAERDALKTAYDELVGDSKESADNVMLKIADLLSAYDEMVAAKSAMVTKLDSFKSNLTELFAEMDLHTTTATNEICKD
jgi:hypothetical protein